MHPARPVSTTTRVAIRWSAPRSCATRNSQSASSQRPAPSCRQLQTNELGPRRIAVNVVAPGAFETDFSGGIVRDNPVVNKRMAEGTALGRAGVPDDIGPMIASLLSGDNRWINAERIEVSG